MASDYIRDKRKLKGIRYMLLAIAAINALASIAFAFFKSFRGVELPMYLETFFIGLLAYVVPIFIYAKITKMTAAEASDKFYLKKCSPGLIAVGALLGIGCQFVMIVLNLPLNLIFKASSSYTPLSGGELAAAIFVVGVMPSVFEEFLFRGIVFGSMSDMNTKAALVFSTVMFSVLHADLYGFLGYLFMGLILATVLRRSDSVFAAMAFHFANNITALLLGYFNSALAYAPMLTIMLFVGGIVEFAVAFAILLAVTKKPKKVEEIKTSQLLGQSFVNLPILLCFVITVAAAVFMRML